jgi:hypothetical protein
MTTEQIPIRYSIEAARGCGYRKPGGIYLVTDGLPGGCGKLPIPVEVCPCCGQGIKPARGCTWIDGDRIVGSARCSNAFGADVALAYNAGPCHGCPLREPIGQAGLLWVGHEFYANPRAFDREAAIMGISRRIAAVPHGFELGRTWVFLAHRRAIDMGQLDEDTRPIFTPAIFRAFRPTRLEYIVRDTDTPDMLARLIERGFTLVRVERLNQTGDLFDDNGQSH